MKSIKSVFVPLTAICLFSCNQPKSQDATLHTTPRRFGMVTGLKPEKVAYYEDLHANAWEGVLRKLKACHIQNYSIYVQKIEDKYYLFSYYEYTGDNYAEDINKIASDSTTQRWWHETDPCQIPLPEAVSRQKIWTTMTEVFHMN